MKQTITTVNTVNTPAIKTSAGTAIADSGPVERSGWMVQNLGTNPLFVKLGADASTTVFHTVLKGATAQDDGTGGTISQTSGAVYQGIITVAGTSPRFVALEMN